MDDFRFDIVAEDAATGARAGLLQTPHGAVETPVFMPVGTRATVKTLNQQDLLELDAAIVLANAYHLYLRPGHELVARAGGLHGFMNWPRAVLTDSGGFQVFSLTGLTRIEEEGVHFQSHIDGSRHLFTPEKVMEIEHALGADIIMAFDECTAYPCTPDYARASMERTQRWAERCVLRHDELSLAAAGARTGHPALFGIVQGSVFPEMREWSARALAALDLPGYALGGLGVGEPRAEMLCMIEATLPHQPAVKPRYLMGVGLPHDLVEAVSAGIDMFDCVIPTRNARNGTLFTPRGRLRIKNAAYAEDLKAVDADCGCRTCSNYHRAYLRHLFQTGEILGLQLATFHNLSFYLGLMRSARQAIIDGDFAAWRDEFLGTYQDS